MEPIPVSPVLPDMHPTLRELVELSAQRKWMSYEELNTTLPDEMVDPERLDELLVLVDQLGVEFIDEEAVRRNAFVTFQAPLQTNLKFKRDDRKKTGRPPRIDFEDDDAPVEDHDDPMDVADPEDTAPDMQDDDLLDEAEAQAVIQEAIAESGSKRIDYPITGQRFAAQETQLGIEKCSIERSIVKDQFFIAYEFNIAIDDFG
jgi:hypothetical protein